MPCLVSFWIVMGVSFAAFVFVLLAGCVPSEKRCERVIWRSGSEPAQLRGEWDGWRPQALGPVVGDERGQPWRGLTVSLAPGRHRYAFAVGGAIEADPLARASAFLPARSFDPSAPSDDPFAVEVSELSCPDAPPAPPAADRSDELIYQVVVDRFRGPDGALAPPASPGDRAGGSFDGVTAAIGTGYFERLGVTTLWLSPPYRNPPGRHPGRDGRLYEAYHGYWPSEPRAVEPALGGEAALERLVQAAHARGLRVLFDAVPNHIHVLHPYYKNVSWINGGARGCVCGAPGCDWGEHLESCWFGPELPDLDWRNPAVAEQGAADLVWWLTRFNLDGARLDAVPMMPRAAARRMVAAAHALDPRQLIIGEVYTGPGEGGREQIRAYLGDRVDGLDSAFDFPLAWELRRVLARGEGGFDDLERARAASDEAFAGSGATLAHFADNHDLTRFVSEAAGSTGPSDDPWLQPPSQPREEAPYRRLAVALAWVLTLPGIPVLYYGDEVGLAGGADPDSRRVMPDERALSPAQARLFSTVARVGRLRRCLPSLRRGPRQVAVVERDREVLEFDGARIEFSREDVTIGLPSGSPCAEDLR
jgi:glycosidase